MFFLTRRKRVYQRLYDYGLEDSFRKLNPTANDKFSWFDYRSKGFDDNRGLRIDHILVSQKLADAVSMWALHWIFEQWKNLLITHRFWAEFK